MSEKNPTSRPDKTAAKKAAVLGAAKKRNPLHLAVMAACAVLVVGGSVFFLSRQGESGASAARVLTPDAQASEVSFPAEQFADGKSRLYEYTVDGVKVRYFILKSSDGVIRSAFDACDSCWRAGKGYEQQGDDMVCRNCRQHFPSAKVNVVKGGCNPSPLPNRIQDGKVVIRLADIAAGKTYFDLGKGG